MIAADVLRGSMTALVTPFREGAVDEKAYQRLCDWQIKEGTDVLVTCGTTGEPPTMDAAEHERVMELCIEVAKNRVPVVAGTGSNSTTEAIYYTRCAEKLGADFALLTVPYYNKPTPEGLYQHFKAVHDATHIPLILYNVPGRTVTDMMAETIGRLAKLPRIVAIKEASVDLTRPARTRSAAGEDFIQLSGEDATIIPFLANGGVGCISVTANVAPRLLAELHDLWRDDDLKGARQINDRLMPLHDALFAETSPAPAKFALSLLGICANELRLPLVPVTEVTEKKVRAAMQHAGLIN
jgi:4-hydroxy-tetrahydrodipicolinate synthase